MRQRQHGFFGVERNVSLTCRVDKGSIKLPHFTSVRSLGYRDPV